jgi:putative molybdopterin biosynthesis protein
MADESPTPKKNIPFEGVQAPAGLPVRRAALVHRAETFLMDVINAGYTQNEIEQAIRIAFERWRAIEQLSDHPPLQVIRFAGSHDLAVDWIAANFNETVPQRSLQVNITGSLGGLIALAEGKADLVGCHLWDEDTDSYNAPFVQRLMPGWLTALVTLAQRRVGLLTAPGNPYQVHSLADLAKTGLRWVNRQSGSSARSWLDAALRKQNIDWHRIIGYHKNEVFTHSDVARRIVSGQADAGMALEATAIAFGLEFFFLTLERYDLVIPADNYELPPFQALIDWLKLSETRTAIASLGGYDTSHTGEVTWVH